MFETLNAVLGNEMIRYTLLMGTGALMAYTLRPLPSAIDSFANCNLMKFGTLFLFGALLAHPLDMSKFMVLLFAALMIIVLFEYFRQIDKGRSALDAAAETAKEFMFGQDPMASYPAQIPYADPRMGIPQYLPDGKTAAVTFSGHAGGWSNTGNFTTNVSNEGMRGDALYQGLPLSYPGAAPYGDKHFGIPSQTADGSPGLVYSNHTSAPNNLEAMVFRDPIVGGGQDADEWY